MMETRRSPRRTPRRAVRPTVAHERRAWQSGCTCVAGVDEAGRGAWAGPLVAAAASLPRDGADRARLTRALNRAGLFITDSKLLTHEQRVAVVDVAIEHELDMTVVEISPREIDGVGLGAANLQALAWAAERLRPAVDHVLVDAFRLDTLSVPHVPIIRGDRACQSIALASIVAKVHRDLIMIELDRQFPEYGFARHKGYGTAVHRRALALHGVSPLHRYSFAPVAEVLASE